jgi:probable rRNA maturation factor
MRVSVNYFYESTAFRLKCKTVVTSWIGQIILKEKKKSGTVCIIFCSDAYLLDINKKFLKRNYLTDVISFDYSEKSTVSGDIYISTERISENAVKNETSFNDELYRIIAHGVLHLAGYSDESMPEKLAMTEKENIYLANIYKLLK